MSTGNIRRAQLVSPFGVGAMSVLVDGSSVITAGLDHWFDSGETESLSLEEFAVPEWRLEERLHVQTLRLPPDFRRPRRGSGQQQNLLISVPVLRFPRWCFCIYCKRLHRTTLSMAEQVRCPDDSHDPKKKGPVMSQVPFVVMCERGHLDDFPFREWVHKQVNPRCQKTLRLISQGGATLAGQLVKCDCGDQRNLEGITQGAGKGPDGEDQTVLSTRLASGQLFLCSGSRPWVADPGSGCGWHIRGALRGAGNVYFAKVESSIYLPPAQGAANPEVLDFLRRPDIFEKIRLWAEFVPVTANELRKRLDPALIKYYTDDELQAGLDALQGEPDKLSAPSEDDDELTSDSAWRHPEYALLRETPNYPDLKCTDPGVPDAFGALIGRIRRVEVLRETRALRGFTRVRDARLRLSVGKEMLRRNPVSANQDWLPAYVVKGEGIYLELDASAITEWEARIAVVERAAKLTKLAAASRHGAPESGIPARFILLHTLAHVLMNELVFTCGYSSASLRERLYVSQDPHREMAALLIYTAAGDSEGTMGGLVRMANRSNWEAVLKRSLDAARWCATDPVCMEVGDLGQGPDSCNLAACHGCGLVPETSCEQFNRFLDRGLLIGTLNNPSLGYFSGAAAHQIADLS